jgi:transposase-like protein
MSKAVSKEFRNRAVEMELTDGNSVGVAALHIGVSVSGWDRWVRKAGVDRGITTRAVLSPSDARAETVGLHKEVRR